MGRVVHLLAPAGFDDPARPSGGNVYDRRVAAGLAAAGWEVRVAAVPGAWPRPDHTALAALERSVAAVPDGDPVLIDGLVASCAAPVLVRQAGRVRLVVLVHMPLLGPGEAAVLTAAAGVVTTSAWTRERLLERYRLDPMRVRVARPGVDPAPVSTGTPGGGSLLCVATVVPHKGHDVLLAALGGLTESGWRCVCAGSLQADPDFAHLCAADGLGGRVAFPGVLTGAALERAYAGADLLIAPSRSETYGMVVTEALARGVPVLASDVGGLPEALGYAPDGSRPGRLVAPECPAALARVLRSWLGDDAERERLRAAAYRRRAVLEPWDATVDAVAAALVNADTRPGAR